MTETSTFLISILPRLPLLAAYVVGVVMALSWARGAPGGGLAAGIGFALLAAAWMVGTATQYWIMTTPREVLAANLPTVAWLTWIREGAGLAGTILLMVALFRRRPVTL